MSVNSHWQKFRALSPRERRQLLRAWLLLPGTAFCLRLLGFGVTCRLLRHLAHVPTQTPASLPKAQELTRLVAIAGRHHVRSFTCLEHSLTVWAMLQAQGIAGELRIGVRKEAGKFLAHAWVEVAGCVVNDRAQVTSDYAPFAGELVQQKKVSA
jgi:hypothetical protein